MEFRDLENFMVVMWSGDLDEDRLLLHYCKEGQWVKPLKCRGAVAFHKTWKKVYTSDPERGYQVIQSAAKNSCTKLIYSMPNSQM